MATQPRQPVTRAGPLAALLLAASTTAGCPGTGTVAFEFKSPEADVQLRPGDTQTIAWEGQSLWEDGTVTIRVYRQLTGPDESIQIARHPFPDEPVTDSLQWEGDDLDGEPLRTGLYNLTAIVTRDGLNNYSFEAGEGQQIALQGLYFEEPVGPVTFTGTLTIGFETMSFDNLTVDLLLELDEEVNEDPIIIGSGIDVLAELAIQSTNWSWDGTDIDGQMVPAGDYLLEAYVADDIGSFFLAQAQGVVISVP